MVALGRAAFETDSILRHAAKSIIADIGEAAKNLEEVVEEIDDVPWTQIARMRDRVIHRYFDVDYGVVWDTLVVDIPRLERAIRDFIAERNASTGADDRKP